MMKRLMALWILLIVQLVVAVLLWWPHPQAATGQLWLAFKPAQISKVTLTEGGKAGKQLTLEKRSGKWVLPAAGDFPASHTKVAQLLKDLAGLKGNLPVAVTQDAAKRFRVAKHDFESHLVLKAGDKTVADVYVGNAAGSNLVYLRRAGKADIETQHLPAWLLDTQLKGWRDPQLLHLADNQVTRVVLPGVTLGHQGNSWQALKPAGSTSTLDATKARALVDQLTQLNYRGVAGKQHPVSAPVFKVTVKTHAKTLTYAFVQQAHKKGGKQAKSSWLMKRSDLPWVFQVSSDVVKSLQQASLADLKAVPAGHHRPSGKTHKAEKPAG